MTLIKSFSVYAFALFFNAALSFGTFSLLTHHLSEIDYGIINLYNSFTIFMIPFISVGVQFTLSVDYFKMDETTYRSHFINGIMLPVIMCLLITFLFLVFHNPLRQLIKTNLFFLLTLPLSCLMVVTNDVILNLSRNKGKHFVYAGILISKNIIETGMTILLVLAAGLTWQGRLGGSLIALLLTGITVYFLIRHWGLDTGRVSKPDIKNIFRHGLPFIPERLAIFFLTYSDRFFIDYYEGTGDVGYYGAGAQIALIVNLTILSLISAVQPYIFRNLAISNWKNVRKGTFAFIGVSTLVTAGVIVCTPLLFELFIGENFQKGQVYAKYLTIGFFLWSIYAVFVAYLLYMKKNKVIMIISIMGMTLSVICNLINVKQFGAVGATYSSMIVYCFMAVACIYTVHKNYNLKKILFRA